MGRASRAGRWVCFAKIALRIVRLADCHQAAAATACPHVPPLFALDRAATFAFPGSFREF
jgi:hypothetical protein